MVGNVLRSFDLDRNRYTLPPHNFLIQLDLWTIPPSLTVPLKLQIIIPSSASTPLFHYVHDHEL